MTQLTNLLIGLIVLALLVQRQTATRPFDPGRGFRGTVVLALIGLAQLGQDPAAAHARGTAVIVVAGSILAAGAFGLARGQVMRVWRTADGRTWRAGTATSVLLWLIPVALHLAADHYVARLDPAAAGLGAASMLLYLAVSLAGQRLALTRRAAALGHDLPVPVTEAAPSRRW
jgi:hypothetical protein